VSGAPILCLGGSRTTLLLTQCIARGFKAATEGTGCS